MDSMSAYVEFGQIAAPEGQHDALTGLQLQARRARPVVQNAGEQRERSEDIVQGVGEVVGAEEDVRLLNKNRTL